jgi:hypothetical protein
MYRVALVCILGSLGLGCHPTAHKARGDAAADLGRAIDVAIADAGRRDGLATPESGAAACTIFLGAPPLPEFSGLQKSIEVGDLDGDGHADLVATIRSPNQLSIVFGRGGGVFGPHVDYPTGNGPERLRIVDLDGDGDLDVVVVNSLDQTLGVFLNRDDGSLAARVDYEGMVLPNHYTSIAVGDVNGDGRPDVATVGKNVANLLLNNGDGTFAAKREFAVKTRESFYGPDIAFGDLNRDGRADLVVPGATTSVLFGQADGTLSAATEYAESSYAVAVGDLNRDGFPDIVTGNQGALLNRGDGTFDIVPKSGTQDRDFIFALGDLTGDGILDIAMLWDDSEVVIVMPGRGDGTFPEESFVYYYAPDYPYSVAIGDLNGDGHNDLVLENETAFPTVLFYPDFGLQTYQRARPMARKDLNGDGLVDVVTLSFDDYDHWSILVMLRQIDGSYVTESVHRADTSLSNPGIGDLDGDGVADLVASYSWQDGMVVLFGKGDGTFSDAVELSSTRAETMVYGDWNGDGLLDLASAPISGETATVSLAVGNGSFGPAVPVYTGRQPEVRTAGDVNRDGHIDLVISDWSTTDVVSVLLGAGDGTFSQRIDLPVGEEYVGPAVLADLNGDTSLDLAVTVPYQSKILVAFGKGDGFFGDWAAYDTQGVAWNVRVGDIDGDGWSDLIAVREYEYAVLLNRGDGTFAMAGTYPAAGINEGDVTLIDDDGDSRLDLMKAVDDGVRTEVQVRYNLCR